MFELFSLGQYDTQTIMEIYEAYDIVKKIRNEINYDSTQNEPSLLLFYSDEMTPPLEDIRDIIAKIPKRRLRRLKKKMTTPKKLAKILKREPVARELTLPKKTSQLMNIILNKGSTNQDEEYRKAINELNAMLGKSTTSNCERELSTKCKASNKLDLMVNFSHTLT